MKTLFCVVEDRGDFHIFFRSTVLDLDTSGYRPGDPYYHFSFHSFRFTRLKLYLLLPGLNRSILSISDLSHPHSANITVVSFNNLIVSTI